MMLARKLAIDELGISDEPPLPLDNLDRNFICSHSQFPPEYSRLRFAPGVTSWYNMKDGAQVQ
jgi:hypothetical protein